MKKHSIIAIVLLISVFALAGCAKKQSNGENSDNSTQREFNRRPDFGQPETPADIMGIVKSVIGNEVTLLKIERPERTGQSDGNEDGSDEGEENRDRTNSAPALGGITGGTTGGRVPGVGGRGGFRTGGGDTDMQAQMLERMKEMSTGEVKVIVPVGIRMLMPVVDSESNEPQVVEATLADIKADKMMQIWVNNEVTDRQVADFVLIMR